MLKKIVKAILLNLFLYGVIYVVGQFFIVFASDLYFKSIIMDALDWLFILIVMITVSLIIYSAIKKSGNTSKILNTIFESNLTNSICRFVLIFSAVILVISTTLFCISPVSIESEPEDFTVLFDDNYGPIAKLGLKVIFTPLAVALKNNNENVSILPISKENIIDAFEKSKYIFIASHGSDGIVTVQSANAYFDYTFLEKLKRPNLKFIYFTACQLGIGSNMEKYINAVSPSEITLFDRNSAILEHFVWIVFRSYGIIKIET